jgi:pantoate--beta-alanine ligase
MRRISGELRKGNSVIGFVPTMGFLHDGHLTLVRQSIKNCDVTVVSIFVNPTQFSPTEDLSSYPRNLEKDFSLLANEGVDYVFVPDASEIYPEKFQTYVEVSEITKKHEGEFRPTHFKGVTTVVAILFNIVQPDKAFFGQKDAQQSVVIKKMVRDLNYDIEIIVVPTVREAGGLAMSSRNTYLDIKQKQKALIIYNSLNQAKELIAAGERDSRVLIKNINNNFLLETSVHLNYIRIVDAEDFTEPVTLEKGKSYFILIACKIGTTRLIDNLLVEVSS